MKIKRNVRNERDTYKLDAKRVIILGAGQVGSHIAQRLSTENYDVILIDEDEEKIKESRFIADIGTYVGNGCDAQLFVNINLNEKDLFVAVTSTDEANLIACHIAKAFGCSVKIARVRQPFYKNLPERSLGTEFWRKLGVEILLNQDEITSKEIVKLVDNPGSVGAIELGRSDAQLVAYRVKKHSLLIGRRLIGLKDVPMFDNILVVAVVRSQDNSSSNPDEKSLSPIHIKAPTEYYLKYNYRKNRKAVHHFEEILIPQGDFRIQEGDVLYISGLKKDFKCIRDLFDYESAKDLKNIFILSSSSLACLVAKNLMIKYSRKDIYLITKDKREAFYLRDNIHPKINVLLVDMHNIQELIHEGLDERSIFIGASDNEDDNVVACLLVKEETEANTIAVVQSSIYTQLIPYLEIDALVSPKILLVDDILKALRKNVYDVLFSKGLSAEVLEFVIRNNSSHINKKVKELDMPKSSIIAIIIRKEKPMIPNGKTKIIRGDHVIVFTLRNALEDLQSFFLK